MIFSKYSTSWLKSALKYFTRRLNEIFSATCYQNEKYIYPKSHIPNPSKAIFKETEFIECFIYSGVFSGSKVAASSPLKIENNGKNIPVAIAANVPIVMRILS